MAKIPDSVAQKIQAFCDNRAAGDDNLSNSSIYKQIVDTTNKFLRTSRRGGLASKDKVLMLVGIHATNGTEQSIHFAITAALQAGVSEEEISDALELALLTGGGEAVARVQFASNVLQFYKAPRVAGKKKLLAFVEQRV